jgi:8-oxo-dGTP pyrophosphatase MutT (NUDIX family)
MLTKQKTSSVAVLYNNKLLLLKRGNSAPWMPNKYCLPGGKIEPDESLVDAASRELYEETKISVDSRYLTPIDIYYHSSYSKKAFIYQPKDEPNIILNYEHSDYVWNSVTEIYSRDDTVPSVKKVVKTLVYWGYFI